MAQSFVLVINSGSSSLKFALIDPASGETILSGLGECFGLPEAEVSWKYQGEKTEEAISQPDNQHQYVIDRLVRLIESLGLTQQIVAVGHRVVHGGEKFTSSVVIDDQVLSEVETLCDLAPLHNPAGATGIRAAKAAYPNLPQVAVFDTAFHQTMPARAYTSGISRKLYDQYGIRSYGFHGTSHYYVSSEAAKMLDKQVEDCNVITVHLGNGASVCVVKGGESIDTSMGFTPLAGLLMGTRSGDLDPGVIEFLLKKGWKPEDIFKELNKNSGFLGVSGLTSDARGILKAMSEGHEGAKLAFEVFTYRVAKYVSSYMVALDHLDAIVFTGGIGENSGPIRSEILRYMKIHGYEEDPQVNQETMLGKSGIITKPGTPVVMVIPTNEELVIARDAAGLI